MSREYTGVILRTAQEMYKTLELAKLLNPDFTEESYKEYIDDVTAELKFTQRVVLCNGEPCGFAATHRVAIAGKAPKKCATIANIATLPEHRGVVTQFLIAWSESDLRNEDVSYVDIRSQVTNKRATACYEKAGYKNGESHSWRKQIAEESIDKGLRAKL